MSKKLNPNKINQVSEIVTDREELSTYCDEIDPVADEKLVKEIVYNLKKLIREKDLLYLTAPQIGYSKRVMAINFSGDIRVYINPIIAYPKGLEISREKCNSLSSEYVCFRAVDITAIYSTEKGKVESVQMVGVSAKVYQHALDHLGGLLLSDFAIEIDEDFDKLSEDEKAELYRDYSAEIEKACGNIDRLKKEDVGFKKTYDAIDFLAKLQTGEVKLKKGE